MQEHYPHMVYNPLIYKVKLLSQFLLAFDLKVIISIVWPQKAPAPRVFHPPV
jgi:hypothetical protein